MARPGRPSHGLTKQIHVRARPDEAQMGRDMAAHLGTSMNAAYRWAIRYAWQHATSTTDHSACVPTSPCAGATQGITPGKAAHDGTTAQSDQMVISHSATVEE